MPKFKLLIKADLENITDLKTDEDMRWYLKLKFTQSGEVTEKPVFVCAQEHEKHNRNTFNLVIKDKLNGREATVDIVSGSAESYTAEDSGRWKAVICFDCRGVEPVEYEPGQGFTGTNPESGTSFEVDLSEDWTDFDDDASQPVGVYSFKSKFEKA